MTDNLEHAAALENLTRAYPPDQYPITWDIMDSAAKYLRSLTTINPVSGLPQSPEQVRAERDMLISSQRSLLEEVQRLKKLSKSRLDKMQKLRMGLGS